MKAKHLLMSLLCALMPLAASAYDFEVDGLYFNKTNEGEVEVVKGKNNYSGDVVVPASITVDGVEYAVTAIGQQAFKFCGYLTSIVISEGVKTIEDEAFVTCTSLVSVEFPASLREIGQDAFYASSLQHRRQRRPRHTWAACPRSTRRQHPLIRRHRTAVRVRQCQP